MPPNVQPTTTPNTQMGEYTQEQLMSMPLDQLEQMVLGKAKNLGEMQRMADPTGGEAPPADLSNEGMIDGALVMAATTKLAELGLPVQPTQQLTPDVVKALQAALDKVVPGLYNLSNPDDLEEVLNGIISRISSENGKPDWTFHRLCPISKQRAFR